MRVVVLWEVSGKQNYIFSGSRLKESLGASIIIKEVTEKLSFEICNGRFKENQIYNGGGSSLTEFGNRKKAEEFIKILSTEIIKEYPGLEIFMVIEEFDNKKDRFTEVIDNAYLKLAQKKSMRKNSGGLLSFGVEKKCEATGQPSSYIDYEDGERKHISREVKVKLDNSNKRIEEFSRLIPYESSIKAFSEIAKGDKNYMAVVHIDGNKMGRKFSELKNHFDYGGNNYEKINNEYLSSLKSFSNGIKDLYEAAFIHMTNEILNNKDRLDDDTYINSNKFPVIPIIVAGDDITYITNGKIGLESARIFIEYLNSKELTIYKDKKDKLNACAGVAIVRSTYPFAKAYELAEDLCKNAKKRLINDYGKEDKDYSLIDWHIDQGDISGNIEEVRDVNYVSYDNKKLYMRPIYLNNSEKWNNYENFKNALNNITKLTVQDENIARSKLKRLRNILKSGEKDTKLFLKSNKIENYFSRLKGALGDYCFFKDNCMYYDALEVLDLFISLDGGE